jgi:predicted nucleotidyltransferase
MIRHLKRDDMRAIRRIIELAIQQTGLRMIAVYLHGSYGTEYMRDDSDIDLAFLSERPLTFDESIAFSAALAQAHRGDNLDTVGLRQCDAVFVAQVVTDGERIYTGDELEAQRFEMTALSRYARLNEERAAIIEDIRQRGRVYGCEAPPA